jgi:hypothetical protein
MMQLGKVPSFHKQRYKVRGRLRVLFRILQITVVVAATLLQPAGKGFSQSSKYSGEPFVPADGFVPDEVTAIQIAKAVLNPIYGTQIEGEKPYISKLVNGIWIITGSLPPNYVGGVFEIWIDKKTGAIVRVSHSQ